MTLRILTLLDIMREFDAWNFAHTVQELTKYTWIAFRWKDKGKPEIDKEFLPEIEGLVEELQRHTRHLQLKASHQRATRELSNALGAYGNPTWERLGDELRILWEIMMPEMRGKRFASIDAAKDDYLIEMLGDPPHVKKERRGRSPIWLTIWKRFKSAKEDSEEMVYCYALERNTACVFHSMRVAEIGLRALARRMKVKLPKKKQLEWAQWRELLKKMSEKTDYISQNAKAGPAKDELLEFYNGAIGQFYGFKDEFRNQVMHVRKTYDQFEAARALTRVRDFMEKLAHHIDERGRRVKK